MARGGESAPEKWMDMVPLVGPNAPRAPARREACWLPSQSHPSARQGAVVGAASRRARGVAQPTNAKGGRATCPSRQGRENKETGQNGWGKRELEAPKEKGRTSICDRELALLAFPQAGTRSIQVGLQLAVGGDMGLQPESCKLPVSASGCVSPSPSESFLPPPPPSRTASHTHPGPTSVFFFNLK